MTNRPGQPDARLCRPAPRGFTLVEMTVSLAVLSILLIAIGSAIMLAAKTLPQESDPSRETTWAVMTVEDMATELQYALSFSERSATVVEFTVADRDSDGSRETIRYAWSGTAGDPLTRQYNGGPVTNIVEGVQEFELLYDTIVTTELVPSPTIESAEILLASETSAAPEQWTNTASGWTGQYFQPSLPADAIDWKVTRVLFEAKQVPPVDGVTSVQLRKATVANLPSATILEQTPMSEADLSPVAFAWEEFFFSNVTGRPPGTGLCLVLESVVGTELSVIRHTAAAGSGRLETLDSGASWSSFVNAMHHYVYGTYTKPGPAVTVNHTYLTGVRIKLRAGEETVTLVQTGTPLLHVKEITP